MRLPSAVYADNITKGKQSKFSGLNHNEGAGDGELYAMRNLCSDYYPLLATRQRRMKYRQLTKGNGLFVWEKLCWVDGTGFYYDGELKGQVEDSEKSFAAINGYIIIAPDMAYYNIFDETFGHLEAEAAPGAGEVVFMDGTLFGEAASANTISCSSIDWADVFKVGDAITITGGSITANNITAIIREIDGHELHFYENSFTNGTDSTGNIRFTRKVPELKYLLENENRLWGCTETTIFASKLGDPFNFYVYDGLDTDAFAVDTGSSGVFTGAISYLGYPTFFKEKNIYKVYGSIPSNFEVMGSATLGLAHGSENSLAIAGETLFYETSPEVKALRWGERRRRFMDLMENQYRGRTAKFTVDGETYYARFAKEDVKKIIYGDLNSDRPGHDAKINAGADGDIFDLVENARYDHSEDERGKTSKAHRGIESWDYFVKKVQIDGKVFDLLANVRKSSDAEYVYSLQLNEDKSAEAAPPNRLANDQSLTRALTASTDSITEESENSNTRFSMDDSEIPGAIWGDEDETFVNDTEPVKFRWAIVPLESLVVSNDTSGSVNPAYPAELQPRNRGRQASQLQMEKISRNINPRQLEDSPNAQNGAPIIRSDGVVIGGNIRSMALTDAYAKGRADAYRDYVASRAARKFGLDTSELPEHPVLVRVAEDVSDWGKLARDLNTSTIAAYSATERAMADAARMDSRIMAMLNPDEDGNINTTANKDFIQSFVSNVIPDNERGAAITGSGLLSQDGLERAEYAIFAAAYKDADLMQRMSESLDNDMKNVTNGLLDIAPKVMQYQSAVDAGQLYDTRATENLLAAVCLYTEAKRSGMTVEERTANQSLTDDFTDEIIYTARIIEKFKRSAKQIRTFFNGLYDEIENIGDPNQLNFFGEEEDHDYREALEGAIKRYERATDTQLPSLGDWGAGWYEATDRGNETKSAEPVHESPDPGSGESDGGAGRVEPEIPEDTGLHLPPPPGTEETAPPTAPKPETETRQRDLERMAKRREKDSQKKQKQRKPPKFPFAPEYDPLTQYKDAADPVKEFIKAVRREPQPPRPSAPCRRTSAASPAARPCKSWASTFRTAWAIMRMWTSCWPESGPPTSCAR